MDLKKLLADLREAEEGLFRAEDELTAAQDFFWEKLDFLLDAVKEKIKEEEGVRQRGSKNAKKRASK